MKQFIEKKQVPNRNKTGCAVDAPVFLSPALSHPWVGWSEVYKFIQTPHTLEEQSASAPAPDAAVDAQAEAEEKRQAKELKDIAFLLR